MWPSRRPQPQLGRGAVGRARLGRCDDRRDGPGRGRKGYSGITVHNVRRLAAEDRTIVDGIPVTSVERTLLDYAQHARHQQLRHALEATERAGLFDLRKIEVLLDRSRGHHGLGPLRAGLAELSGPAPETRSRLERKFLTLIRDAGLPEPSVNVMVAGFLVDLYWPAAQLVVEVDSYGFHRSRAQFEENRLRDTKLQLAGVTTIRVTQKRIEQDRRGLLADVSALVSRGGGAAASDR